MPLPVPARALLGLALAVQLAACGSSSTAAGSPAAAIGQSIEVVTVGGGRAIVTVLSVSYHAVGIGPIAQPPENGQYAVADVSVQARSGSYMYAAPYFGYQAADGSVYSWTDGHGITAGFEPPMEAGTLSAGESTRGLITFDVPRGAGRDIQLTGLGGRVLGEWRL